MKAAAVQQAKARLERARLAILLMEASKGYHGFEAAWIDFLLAASGVYSKLEQGAKGHGKSNGWFGRKKAERKRDQLLHYLHQARNAAEHGIKPTTRDSPIEMQVGDAPAWHDIDFMRKPGARLSMDLGDEVRRLRFRGGPALDDAVDSRFGNVFPPPRNHLGTALGDDLHPLEVARLGLAYLTKMLEEAQGLVE